MKKSVFFTRFFISLYALIMAAVFCSCSVPTADGTDNSPEPTVQVSPDADELSAEEFLILMEEAEQKIQDHAGELAAQYAGQAGLPEYKQDPWVSTWKTRGVKRRLYVTVYRETDVARAEELLQEYDFVEVVWEKNNESPLKKYFEKYDSSLRKSRFDAQSLESDGALKVEPILHEVADVPAQGFGRVTFTWNGEPFEYSEAYITDLEVYDEAQGLWYVVPLNGSYGGFGPANVYTMQSGEQTEYVMTTGYYRYDFPPGLYRLLYKVEKDPLGKDCMYFAGEFRITEENAA